LIELEADSRLFSEMALMLLANLPILQTAA